jgi:hypothetical protein
MARKQRELEVVAPEEAPEEMPLPPDPKAIFLGGLFALALLTAIYVAAETSTAKPSPLTKPMAIAAQTTRSNTWRSTSLSRKRPRRLSEKVE